MIESTTKLQEETVKVQRKSLQMQNQCERLCQDPTFDAASISIEDMEKEAWETENLLESLTDIMDSIHTLTSTLGEEESESSEGDESFAWDRSRQEADGDKNQ